MFFLSSGPLWAAGQPEMVWREITWEQLLPEEVRGEEYFSASPANGEELETFLEKREHAPANIALQGNDVKIYGFVVPLERNEEDSLTEFLLVPYFGACIHVPPPPQNQIIHVIPDHPVGGIQSMDTVFVYGRIRVEKTSSAAGDAAYRIKAVKVEREAAQSAFQAGLALSLTLLCGMSVCLGWVGPVAAIRLDHRMLGLGVAFAGGVMTCLGLFSAVAYISAATVGLFLLGAALMAVVDFLLHPGKRKNGASSCRGHMGAGSALAVGLHNLPECFIVFSSAMADTGLGLALGGAMIAHNIPSGISIGLSSGGRLGALKAWSYAAFAGFLPPLAAVLAYFSLRPFFSPENVRMLFACAGGALVFIALAEFIPSALRNGRRSTTFIGFGAGVFFLLLVLLFSYWG